MMKSAPPRVPILLSTHYPPEIIHLKILNQLFKLCTEPSSLPPYYHSSHRYSPFQLFTAPLASLNYISLHFFLPTIKLQMLLFVLEQYCLPSSTTLPYLRVHFIIKSLQYSLTSSTSDFYITLLCIFPPISNYRLLAQSGTLFYL